MTAGGLDPRTLRDVADLIEARAGAHNPRRRLPPEALDQLADMLAAGRRPALGWWRRCLPPPPPPGPVTVGAETVARAAAWLALNGLDPDTLRAHLPPDDPTVEAGIRAGRQAASTLHQQGAA